MADIPILDPAWLRRELAEFKFVFLEQVGSTNDWALEAIRNDSIRVPTLVVARKQTAGRGQWDRSWLAPPGNLTFSIALSRGFSEHLHWLPLAAGLGAAEAIESVADCWSPSDEAIRIKWPNDLLWRDQKLGGILVEELRSERVLVIGVGINVHAAPALEGAGPSAPLPAISLREASGANWPLNSLLVACARKICITADQLGMDAGTEELRFRLESRLAWRGKAIRVESGGKTVCEGTLSGLDPRGRLQVQTLSGTRAIASGQISRLTPRS